VKYIFIIVKYNKYRAVIIFSSLSLTLAILGAGHRHRKGIVKRCRCAAPKVSGWYFFHKRGRYAVPFLCYRTKTATAKKV